MLSFILGVAGAGKTTLLLEHLKLAAQSGGRVVLLVPEQYSFEAELAVQKVLGPMVALGVEVLSFTRLCNSIFRELGGISNANITQTGRYLLLSLATSELREHLRVYRKNAGSPAFLEMLATAISELKTAGISPSRLEEVARGCDPDTPLSEKLGDLSAIYAAFQAMVEEGYTDPDDDLIRACRLLREGNHLAGAQVFVDGFTTFMAGEFELLSLLIGRARSATFAITADGLHDDQEGVGVFSPAKQAMRRLIRLARAQGVEVTTPTVLAEPHRYKSPELAHISTAFHLREAEEFPKKPEAIAYYRAPDPYREIQWVAASIARLVREEGLRYRDIAVIARETGPYLHTIESVFLREGIPFFTDARREVENMPLAGGLLAALEAVRGNLDSQAVLAYAKNPLAGFVLDELAALENYCYIWSIRGKLWEVPWQNNPRGMSGALTDDNRAELARLNTLREAIIAPLLILREGLRGCDGKGFATVVCDFLERISAGENLAAFADAMPQGQRETFLDESAQLWESLMEILDVFAGALGGAALPGHRFVELLRLSLSCAEIALRPQTLDEVLVGKADRVRPGAVKAVFVIGAAQGQFPPEQVGHGIFTDGERQEMIELGAQIGPPAFSRAILERLYCYHALTLASNKLFVSLPNIKAGGEPCHPSWLITRLFELFPQIEETRPDTLDTVYSIGGVWEALADIYREDSPQTSTLLQLLGEDAKPQLARLEGAAFKNARGIADPQLAKQLFGERITLSPSRVERYHRCAFSYFARDGLRLRRRERVEFNPLEAGSVLHHVLQVMTQRYGKALFQLPSRQLKEEVRQIIEGYLSERVEQMQALPNRFRYLFERLSDTLVRLLRRLGEEFSQSEYVPVAFELPISSQLGEVERVRPLELLTADGVRVCVEGVVDRVDVMERGEHRYVRVVDYKSGGKQFRLDDVVCGLNMQMLLYLFTISENGEGALGGGLPAGVLYMPVQGKYVSVGREIDESKVSELAARQWKMSGLLLEDEESLRGMEKELGGVFIPAKLSKDGLDGRGALAGKAEMGRLSRKVRELIAEMAGCLTRGALPARPLRSGDFDPCAYCEMGSLCGFEQGDEQGSVPVLDNDKVLAMLGEEDDE
ncbi:MAG: PD-(D/E)XK nuclease family protein [Oscillospiraceae bacterium]|nr:PD-(D/E)XK nuclease family protein [Oscillospiraceae bacterium]